MERVFSNGYCYITILKSVYPDREIRDTCTEACTELSKIIIEIK